MIEKEVIEKAQRDGRMVHVATMMDLCHLKNSELEEKFQKYKGRVVLRGGVLWKTILALALYLPSWVRQHHKSRPQT